MESKSRNFRISNNLIIFGVVIVLALAGFYWVSIRPSRVKDLCDSKARKVAADEDNPNLIDKSDYNFAYQICLHNRGL